ncbi:MAG: transketolase [Phascolarctobacterium sp.]|uniref:transketolase n=1 Tax=Phascolarctobacterium sp. TaxID=2049039 RepID=UPI0026DC66E3|nr:transketolase [Phascolarctobacterium sp.]MDO4921098.1 transketolase [Phascolarctobacterium sp.]
MQKIDQACVNTLRFLAADQVEKAKSGHPGFPLGTAPLMYTIWDRFMSYNPADPNWFNRDRFILSPGHGSALLYAMLHLAGYDLPMEELQNFRQWGSKTPGHPEYGLTPGVDVSTGPLGHGFSMGVGFAIAEAMLGAKYNKPDFPIVDHYTFGLTSDGDLMEGVASEAASLAGTLGLGKLIYLYDDNKITIEGSTDIAFTEDVEARFKAYGWQVLRVGDSEDVEAMAEAIKEAKADTLHPSLIIVRTHIGFGSPKQDNASCHGEPLGADALAATKEKAGWPQEMFYVPTEVKEHFAAKLAGCAAAENAWNALMEDYKVVYPELAKELTDRIAGNTLVNLSALEAIFKDTSKNATREASGDIIQVLAAQLPELVGGSADLGPSNKTIMKAGGFFSKLDRTGRNIHFGVREHAMGTVLNGISLHGGFIPFGGTFLVFADFLRPTIRMAALMGIQAIFVLTHDSIALGEDGPTHQPIETTMGLRLIPNVSVIRPADALETAAAWQQACMNKHKPTCLLLSRQKLNVLHAYADVIHENAAKGAYVLSPAKGEARVILIGTGSEVQLALEAQAKLEAEGIGATVVSMPSWDAFDRQSEEYKASVLPEGVVKFAVEAGVPYGWSRYTGSEKNVLGITTFGASAPGGVMMEKYGFTADNLVAKVKEVL